MVHDHGRGHGCLEFVIDASVDKAWHPANLPRSNPCPGQIALERPDQSPKKTRLDRAFLHHRHHHGICNYSRRRGQLFQPPSGPNLVILVEFHRADRL